MLCIARVLRSRHPPYKQDVAGSKPASGIGAGPTQEIEPVRRNPEAAKADQIAVRSAFLASQAQVRSL